jgi:threonine synthase
MTNSLADGQRSLGDPDVTFPLWPPLVEGCPETSTDEVQYPVEIAYDYDAVDPALFDQPPLPGMHRWQPLLPPLDPGLDLGAGGTPLVDAPGVADAVGFDGGERTGGSRSSTERSSVGDLLVKDESRNPTWSHKDRLVYPTVSAALEVEATGVVVSSTGNHGASVAAHAARADLPCLVLTETATPDSMLRFMQAYGAAVVAVESFERWGLLRVARERAGFHPASNLTDTHTGHPFGPEGYKTIAYELAAQVGDAPGTVFVPTSGAELLFGVWKGFRELADLGVTDGMPTLAAVEPAARGPLAEAVAAGADAATVEPEPTAQHSIKATVNSYRGVHAVEDSDGFVVTVSDDRVADAQRALADRGLWQEFSGAAGVAGIGEALDQGHHLAEPVVTIATSSGFKNPAGDVSVPEIDAEWSALVEAVEAEYGLRLDGT